MGMIGNCLDDNAYMSPTRFREISKNTWMDRDFPNYKVERAYSVANNSDVYRVWYADSVRAAFVIFDGTEEYSIDDIYRRVFVPGKIAIELKLKDLNE